MNEHIGRLGEIGRRNAPVTGLSPSFSLIGRTMEDVFPVNVKVTYPLFERSTLRKTLSIRPLCAFSSNVYVRFP